MTRQTASPLLRIAIVVLALAVVLCLALPMSSGGDAAMNLALSCCFVLAAALGGFLLRRPRGTLPLGGALPYPTPPARGPTRSARAPDVVALGSLLI